MAATPSAEDPLVGRCLGDAYLVLERIGSGATGVVYRARHRLLDQEFAVKVLHPELADDPDLRRNLLKEARALTLFAHENVVQVRHLGEDGGTLFLAMDLCRGETLESLLAREGPLAHDRAARLALQILDALAAAHRAGLVHRDLKPGNVFIEQAGGDERVRVLDFGLARVVGAARERMAGVLTSMEGDVIGTVAYMSPEQIRGSSQVDGRADLFALGVTLYEMVTGRLPFGAGSVLSTMARILEEAPRPLGLPERPAGAPPALEAVLMTALAKDPAARFPSAEAFAAALRAALAGDGSQRPRDAPSRPRVPRRAVAAVGLAALLALALLLLTRRDEPPGATARALALAGRPRAARDLLLRLDAEGRAAPEDLRLLTRLLTDEGDALGLPAAERLTRALPNDAEAAYERGRCLWRVAGRFAEARAELGRALLLARAAGRDLEEVHAERVQMYLAPGAAEAFDPTGEDPRRLAEQEVHDVRARRPGSPEGDILEATLLLRRRPDVPEEDLRRAIDLAHLAAEGAPQLAAAPRIAADAQGRLAAALLAAGRYAESRELARDAERDLTEAISRAERAPALGLQGAALPALHGERGRARYTIDDADGWLADVRAALLERPTSPERAFEEAAALRFAGRFEEALERYEWLREIQPDRNVAFDLAFCWQMLGSNERAAGNVAGAALRYRRAVELYDEGEAVAPQAAEFANYRAECRVELAALEPGEREALLDAAGRDFAAALGRTTEDPPKEVLIRRAAYLAARGDVDGSLADMVRAIGDRQDLNPRFYAYEALARLCVATRDMREGRAAEARTGLGRVLDRVGLLLAQSESSRPTALRLRALARAALARTGPPETRDALLAEAAEDLEAAAADPGSTPRAAEESRLLGAEIGLLARAADGAPAATREREDELARGRWARGPAYFDRLAEDLEAARRADWAARARARAAELPR